MYNPKQGEVPGLTKLLESINVTGINVAFWCLSCGFSENDFLSDVAEDARGFVDSLKYMPRKKGDKIVRALFKHKALAKGRLSTSRRKAWGAIGAAIVAVFFAIAVTSVINVRAPGEASLVAHSLGDAAGASSSRGAPSNPRYAARRRVAIRVAVACAGDHAGHVDSDAGAVAIGDSAAGRRGLYATPPPPATLLHHSDHGHKGLALFEPPPGPGSSLAEPSQEEDKALERPTPVPDLDLDGVGEPAPVPDLFLHEEFRETKGEKG